MGQEWAFLEPEESWETDRRNNAETLPAKTHTCCGILATAVEGEFECGVPHCATTHGMTDEEQLKKRPPRISSRNCNGKRWRKEEPVRSRFCSSKGKRTRSHCFAAQAFAFCKGRRAF